MTKTEFERFKEDYKTLKDYKHFVHDDITCLIVRHPKMLTLSGYVIVSPEVNFYPEEMSDVHGGVTFDELRTQFHHFAFDTPKRVIGFDCGHFDDYIPAIPAFAQENSTYRNQDYVIEKLKEIVIQYNLLTKD